MIWFYFDWISKQKYKVVLLLLLLYYHPVNCYLLSFKFRVIQLCSQRSTTSELNWSIIPFSIICELAVPPPSHHTHTVYTVYSAHFKWKSLLDSEEKLTENSVMWPPLALWKPLCEFLSIQSFDISWNHLIVVKFAQNWKWPDSNRKTKVEKLSSISISGSEHSPLWHTDCHPWKNYLMT